MAAEEKYVGRVEDINDPEKLGRAKIRVPYIHGSIETEYLPWATQMSAMVYGKDGRGGNISIPKEGALVNVIFRDGNLYTPEYYNIQELADDVIEQLQDEYENTHIMAFDDDVKLKMYYTKGKGLTFELDESRVNIASDNSITIEHKDTQSIIELAGGVITVNSDSQINMTAGTRIKSEAQEVWENGKITKVGHEPQFAAVLGEPLMALLTLLATMIDVKMYPTPNVATAAVEQLKTQILSNTVRVSK